MMDTSRTIELGRTVIAMQSANIELWLTTLITLSPDTTNPAAQNVSIELQNLENDTLLDYLSSGNVWVNRGNDMHMSFSCTKLGRPLDSHNLQQLGNCVVNAPAWEQLGLCLSLPLNYAPTQGKLHVTIDRSRVESQSPTNVEAGIESSLGKDLVMAFCESRICATTRKRLKRETAKSAPESRDAEDFFADTIPNAESSCRSDPLLNSACQNKAKDQGESTLVQARLCKTPSNTNFDLKLAPQSRGKRKAPGFSSALTAVEVTDDILSEAACIATLTDAGLRFSICLSLKGSMTHLKVKANTFIHGLANVAPALWRAGYTSACAHVMYTAPTLARSLDHLSLSVKSTRLKGKFAKLKKSPIWVHHEQGLGARSLVGDATSTIADRLWCHVQKTLSVKTASSSIKTLCDPGFRANADRTGEEILEECRDLGTNLHCEIGEQVHDIGPSTTNTCLTSHSINNIPVVSNSQPSDDEVSEEEQTHFECYRSDKQSLANHIRAARDNTEDTRWTNSFIHPHTDDHLMLFSL